MNRREALKRSAAITGIAFSASATLGILKGCSPSGDPKWKTKFLTKEEVNLVSAIADTILPTTETPGALDVHVPEFIDLMLSDNFSLKEQNSFRKGVEAFISHVKESYSVQFEKSDDATKTKIIHEVESKNAAQQGQSFYQMVKELTILGFYTSEYVMTNMLDYHPVPGRFDACIPTTAETKLYVDNNV